MWITELPFLKKNQNNHELKYYGKVSLIINFSATENNQYPSWFKPRSVCMCINLLHENKLEITKIKEIIMKYGNNYRFWTLSLYNGHNENNDIT